MEKNQNQNWRQQVYPFTNVPLAYGYSGLEPYIDTKTMQLHHDKHLQTYINNLNAALETQTELHGLTLEQLLQNAHTYPEPLRTAVIRNGGGTYNHFFWFSQLRPGTGDITVGLSPLLKNMITRDFGSFENFKNQFTAAGAGVFGSGYAWLCVSRAGRGRNETEKLVIVTTPNQDTTISEGCFPLLNLDVWEHAYYLKHFNVRADYIKDFWNVVDWVKVSARLEEYCGHHNCVG